MGQLALKTDEDKLLTSIFYTNLGNIEAEKAEKPNLEKALNYFQLVLDVEKRGKWKLH